ncbi:MAG: cobyric acid synthase, partial [Deltaproteobacteria bacterium]|nr:cobyric acid synthase [Deltaproteobacteria bacterium]
AGSCAEINLLDNDIVNCRMAAYAAAPAILVGDIHRGGIFAQLTGTLACLPEHFRNQIAGFIINRFRGDLSLFRDGTDWIEQNAGKPVYGVLPAYSHFRIEAEDSVVIENPDRDVGNQTNQPAIAVIRTPLISNFTDFDPLAEIAGLDLIFIEKVRDLSSFHAVILPGSKNTRHDLAWLQQTGWAAALREYADSGGHILGICGGYQILGRAIHDPEGLEGSAGSTTGLNLLPVETVIESPKTTTRTSFSWNEAQGEGYEIHMGKTTGNREVTLFTVQSRNGRSTQDKEGCRGSNDRIIGTYIHGLFDMPAITKIWLASIGLEQIELSERHGPAARDRGYDLLAEHVNKHIRVDDIFDLVGM